MRVFLSLLLVGEVFARCFDPTPLFPLPDLHREDPDLLNTFAALESRLDDVVSQPRFDKTIFSFEVTSSKETLWAYHHAAKSQVSNSLTKEVGDHSVYRIASISKVFTVLGILYQAKAGNVSLDDPVLKYLPALASSKANQLPWHSITLRSLASQLSGIPREALFGDLINQPLEAKELALPDVSKKAFPKCDEYTNYTRNCKIDELFGLLQHKSPVFAPNQQSTYSNNAFMLLGLVLENVTGISYEHYLRSAIIEPLNLTDTSLRKPSGSASVIPDTPNWWSRELGLANPTGGIYSSTRDLSKLLRYILTHYNGITSATNWLHPGSYTFGGANFYGMPWEIFRTERILGTRRPITFTTKGGGMPGYQTVVIMSAEHDIGITILTAGEQPYLTAVLDIVTVPLLRTIDKIALRQMDKYAGTYRVKIETRDATLAVKNDPEFGLVITEFVVDTKHPLDQLRDMSISNVYDDTIHQDETYSSVLGPEKRAALTPTLLFANETAKTGEKWRLGFFHDRSTARPDTEVWDDFCFTDVELANYAGMPVNEVIFWPSNTNSKDKSRPSFEVELPAWQLRLAKVAEDDVGSDSIPVKRPGIVQEVLGTL